MTTLYIPLLCSLNSPFSVATIAKIPGAAGYLAQLMTFSHDAMLRPIHEAGVRFDNQYFSGAHEGGRSS